ncbi:MAG: response regulator [Acidobacteria bacterium]|nr:response regulator [Acidobacteriota bacterium]
MAKVLIVDDEPRVRELMLRQLEHAGHELYDAEDAQAALDVMTATPCDVIFCDIQMPGRDGLWLTAELRKLYPMSAVVLATGVSSVPPKVSMQAGVLAYLVKPFTRQALLTALGTAIAWVDNTKVNGPDANDQGDKLTDWLDELKEL